MGYTQNSEIQHGASLGTLILIQEKTNVMDHMMTMFWSYKGQILAIFRKMGLWDTPRIVKFGMEHPWTH